MVCRDLKSLFQACNLNRGRANSVSKRADQEKIRNPSRQARVLTPISCRDGRRIFWERLMKQAAITVLGLILGSLPAMAAPLTVVELFQSQGCSDCPPANANVMALSDRPDLLTLSFGVTYWDQ